MDRGYVKLWRKSIDSRVWASDELWKLWTWCLIKASYRKRFIPIVIGKGVSSVEIMPGQFVWGRLSCAKEFGWNPSTTLKRMKKLESFGCLSLKSDTHYSVVSICNWASYQSEEDTEVTTKCQPSDNQVTTKCQPSDNQVTQTRRFKKLKKEKITPLPPRKPGVDCPVDEIVNLYREICVSFPGIKKLTDQRKKKLRGRWREDKERQNMEWWRNFFTIAAGSSFLCGETGKWRADFDFLLREDKMIKILEGGFDNKTAKNDGFI